MYMGPEFRVWIKFINLKVAHIKASTENHETGWDYRASSAARDKKKKKKKLRQTRTSLRYPEGIDKGRKPRGCRFVFW